MGRLWAHAFGSGGKEAKGARSPKTVTNKMALRIYDADTVLKVANQEFRRDCIYDADAREEFRRRDR